MNTLFNLAPSSQITASISQKSNGKLFNGQIPTKIRKKLGFIFKDAYIDSFWISGGCFASILCDYPIADVDIFSSNITETLNYFVNDLNWNKISENNDVVNFDVNNIKIQVIKRYTYKTMEDNLNDFDFSIVRAAWNGIDFIHDSMFFQDLVDRRLIITSLKRPQHTLIRSYKYVGRGFTLSHQEQYKLIKEIYDNEIDWDDPSQNHLLYYDNGSTRQN